MLSIKSGFFFGAEKFGSRSDDKSPKISKMGPILISIICYGLVFTHPGSWPVDSISRDVCLCACFCVLGPSPLSGSRNSQSLDLRLHNIIYFFLIFKGLRGPF